MVISCDHPFAKTRGRSTQSAGEPTLGPAEWIEVSGEFRDRKIGQDVTVALVQTETKRVSLPVFKPA
jgi:hypothetical protein